MCTRIRSIAVLISTLLVIFVDETTEEAKFCKDIQSGSKELQLKKRLFCDYDPDVRPYSENATIILLDITAKALELDDTTGTLNLYSWTTVDWTDSNMKWDADDYDDIKNLNVPSYVIWVPDIKVNSFADSSKSQSLLSKSSCIIGHSGSVTCDSSKTYSVHCNADYTNYPYDVQRCIIEIGCWSHHSDEIVLDTMPMHHIKYIKETLDKEWTIKGANDSLRLHAFLMDENYVSQIYTMEIVLQRKSKGIHAIYIAPGIALMVSTMTILWLDCRSTERMIVSCMSFICHLICMADLYYIIPYNGANLPLLLYFYENSFLLASFSLVLTVLLRNLSKTSSVAPEWLTTTTQLVLQSKAGQLLLLTVLDPEASTFLDADADDNDDLIRVSPIEKRVSTWDYAVLLLGWIAFVAVFFTYLVMLALYLPSSYAEL